MSEGWGTVLGVIFSWFSPKQRVRRQKDELDKLKKERKVLIRKPFSKKSSNRLLVVNQRIARLERMLANSADD